MRCPFCSYVDTQVKDSRPTEDNAVIRRRRSCPQCGARFTTFERVQLRDLTVIKRDGKRVVFDRDKLTRSIMTAFRKSSGANGRLTQGLASRQSPVAAFKHHYVTYSVSRPESEAMMSGIR